MSTGLGLAVQVVHFVEAQSLNHAARLIIPDAA